MNPRHVPAFINLLCCSLILLSLVSAAAHACICDPWVSVAQRFEWSDAVFSAVVVSINPDTCSMHRQIELVLTRTWKGHDNCSLTLLDWLSSCSPFFVEGSEYLVFAYVDSTSMCRPGWTTNVCFTYPIEDAQAVMDTLDYFGWTLVAEWGSSGSGDAEFNGPAGMTMDSAGNLWVTDSGNHRIQEFDGDGNFITKWGDEGTGDGQFSDPHDVYVDSDGNVFVADSFNDRMQKFTSAGVFLTKWGSNGSGEGEFVVPSAVAVDDAGYVYVVDVTCRIQKFTNEGTFVDQWGEQGDGPGQLAINLFSDIDIAADSLLYVADTGNERIQSFTTDGTFVAVWNGSCAPDGNWFPNTPGCLTADLTGNIYVGFGVAGPWPIGNRPGVVRYNDLGLGVSFVESPSAFGIACAADGRVYITGPYDGVKVYGERTSIPAAVKPSKPFTNAGLRVFPNPFNPVTRIFYHVGTPGMVKMTVHDVRGRLIRRLVHRNEYPGERWLTWDARDDRGMEVSSGVYFVRLEASGKIATQKITLLK